MGTPHWLLQIYHYQALDLVELQSAFPALLWCRGSVLVEGEQCFRMAGSRVIMEVLWLAARSAAMRGESGGVAAACHCWAFVVRQPGGL